jgi:hypothetical protein
MLDFGWRRCQDQAVVNPTAKSDSSTHPNIQEILRKRREMLNRVRADLDRVGKLQQDFWTEEQKRQEARKTDS